jgi:hypothetical protein
VSQQSVAQQLVAPWFALLSAAVGYVLLGESTGRLLVSRAAAPAGVPGNDAV